MLRKLPEAFGPGQLTMISVHLLSLGLTPGGCARHPLWALRMTPGEWETGEMFIMSP